MTIIFNEELRIFKPSVYSRRNEIVVVQKRELPWPQDLDGQARFVELYIVNDFAQVCAINRSDPFESRLQRLYFPLSYYSSFMHCGPVSVRLLWPCFSLYYCPN